LARIFSHEPVAKTGLFDCRHGCANPAGSLFHNTDPELAGFAPLALGDAERALRQVEQGQLTGNQRIHLIYMADHRIKIARALAQREQLGKEYDELEKNRNAMLLKASQLDAAQARREAEQARMVSAATAEEADRFRQEAARARVQGAEAEVVAERAMEEAQSARRLAEARSEQAELAKREAELAIQQASTLRQQLENLQLRQTESGVVVTLGDVLFETGQAELREGAQENLSEVVDLLQSEPDKNIRIEGHTDSVGSAESNLALSDQRANAVRIALESLGIAAERVTSVGLGEDFPIESNETEEGRSQNRRVDVILLDNY
jgi:outer membrane protein OmpA-like peptidoglycan-associated protein